MKLFTKIEKLIFLAGCIKAATGILGASVILSEKHPYLGLTILVIGAVANEFISSVKNREYRNIINKKNENIEGN